MVTALEYWKKQVEAHNFQNTRVEGESHWASGDFWRPLMANFKVNPHRADDSSLNRLKQIVDPSSTVIDVGGGAGRYALPLALHCKHVTVVEPADSMVDVLRESMQEANIENMSVIPLLWEKAEVEQADVVLSAFSVYGVAEVKPFIRKMEANAKRQVIMLVLIDQPQSQFSPLWESIRGEERIDLPALREIMRVLWEMNIYPSLEMFDPTYPQVFDSKDSALDRIRHTLYVEPDSEEDQRLQAAIYDQLVESPEGFTMKGAKPRRLGMLTWTP